MGSVAPAPISASPELLATLMQQNAQLMQQQQALIAQLAQQQAANGQTAPAKPAAAPARTVRELWDVYLSRKFTKGVPTWARTTTRYINAPFEFEDAPITLADQPWTRLTPQMGDSWWNHLLVQPAGLGTYRGEGVTLSPAYCSRLKTALSGCFTWHMKRADRADSRVRHGATVDNITENPIRRWPSPEKEELGKRLAGFEDEEQLEDFLRFAHPQLAEMMRMSVDCGGMRCGEVRGLEFYMIDYSMRTITLPKELTKTGKARTFPVTDKCMDILRRRKAAFPRATGYVFPLPGDESRKMLVKQTLEQWVRKARKKWGRKLNGTEAVVFHHTRHTFAKWALLRGVTPTLVMEYGGWTTYEIFSGYAKANAAMLEQSRASLQRSVRESIAEATGKATAPTRRSAQRASRHDVRNREERPSK